MRKVRYSVAATLDGFIADDHGGYDWIIMDDAIDFAAMFAEFDTFVMGRKTWDVSAQTEFVQMFGGKEVIVFSRTLTSPPHSGVKIVNTSPVDTVRELKQKPGKDIWLFGGGSLFRSLLELGLVDTVGVAIIPVLLGGGVPLLPDTPERAGLRLVEHQVYEKTGTVTLEYAVA
jgi:dihydrofolate reductase